MKVGCRVGDALFHHAGKSNGNAIEVRKRFAQLIQAFHHSLGRWNGGRNHTLSLAHRVAGGIDEHGLQARTADIDAHGDGVGVARRSSARR